MKEIFGKLHEVYIFGASSRGKTVKGYLQVLYPKIQIVAFLVDDMVGNEYSIDGIPVQLVEKIGERILSATVLIATKGEYHTDIITRLRRKGMNKFIPVTVEVDNFLRNAYVKKYYEQEHRSFVKITDLQVKQLTAVIYMAKSIYDKPLQTNYICPDYEKAIQVGAALTSQRLAHGILTDCEGENISAKNRQYCELTALYWIWKHAKEDVIGLSHYRRHFILPDNWQRIMASNEIDVILPVPTFVYPSIEKNYQERHDPDDWEYLMRYLKENSPDDYNVGRKVFSGSLYSPCNMFIMRREVLHNLCQWLFPIVDAVAAYGKEKTDTYLNRYPGFISERLITLYFYKNSQNYHIVYADKNFIN